MIASLMTVFRYSEVIKNLAKRDFKLRYRSSVFGFAWSFLNPLSFMLVMSFVFVIVLPAGISDYPIFLLCGLLPWRFFQVSTSQSLQSIVGNSSLVTKIYFPRQILVLSTTLANFIGTMIEFTILFPLMLAFGIPIRPVVLMCVPLLVYEFVFVYGVSLAVSALAVLYRDMIHLWEVFLNLAIWAAPIMYSLAQIPQAVQPIYTLNPIVPIVTSFRDVLLYGQLPGSISGLQLIINLIVVLLGGLAVFRHFEPRFADEVA
jgi:lipopolysaccharide transport system permease protein